MVREERSIVRKSLSDIDPQDRVTLQELFFKKKKKFSNLNELAQLIFAEEIKDHATDNQRCFSRVKLQLQQLGITREKVQGVRA